MKNNVGFTQHREAVEPLSSRGGTGRENVSVAAAAAPLPMSAEAALRETLADLTPGPYGFQSYGKRTRLVTMAVGDGAGESFAIFTRDEDARAFVRAMNFALAVLAARDEAGEKAGITQAERAQRTSEHPSLSSTGDERREAIEECAKVAESHFYLSDGFRRWKSGEEIASRIRSLLHAVPDGGGGDSGA